VGVQNMSFLTPFFRRLLDSFPVADYKKYVAYGVISKLGDIEVCELFF